MLKNDPVWVEVNCTGENTGTQYFGRFAVKMFLTLRERGDVARLEQAYGRGIEKDNAYRITTSALAMLNFLVVETDAKWWTESSKGLDLSDEAPLLQLFDKIEEIRQEVVKKNEKKETEVVK